MHSFEVNCVIFNILFKKRIFTSKQLKLNLYKMTNIRKSTLDDLKLVAELFDQYRVFYEKESDK